MLLPLISSNSTHILNDSTIYQDKVNILFLHFQISMINLISVFFKTSQFHHNTIFHGTFQFCNLFKSENTTLRIREKHLQNTTDTNKFT